MAYNVELSESAERELGKLDASQAKRVLKFLHQRVAKLDDPRSIGERCAVRGLESSGNIV
jgi:mRNA interferase RelE/StbE